MFENKYTSLLNLSKNLTIAARAAKAETCHLVFHKPSYTWTLVSGITVDALQDWLEDLGEDSDGYVTVVTFNTSKTNTLFNMLAALSACDKLKHIIDLEKPTSSTDADKAVVYVISNGDSVKIGVSRDINKRLKDLQVANDKSLKLLKTSAKMPAKDAFSLEKQLHTQFSNFRLMGEWFTSACLPEVECALSR